MKPVKRCRVWKLKQAETKGIFNALYSSIGILLESIGPFNPHQCLIVPLILYSSHLSDCNLCIKKSFDGNK